MEGPVLLDESKTESIVGICDGFSETITMNYNPPYQEDYSVKEPEFEFTAI